MRAELQTCRGTSEEGDTKHPDTFFLENDKFWQIAKTFLLLMRDQGEKRIPLKHN